MKRWFQTGMLCVLCLTAAAAALSMTLNVSEEMRSLLGRGLTFISLIGLAVCALLRPRALREVVSAVGGEEGAANSAVSCSFSDVAANDVARKSLEQLREYILQPEKYKKIGARMPKGVLLYGPPGTGKTLLAKALAGEAGVPFYAMSGSDFVERYVGVGALRVRELFKKARKAGKCVIFIDEIDALGKKRTDQSSDERDQTLNALLSEMSGFHSGEGVIVLAATNRLEMLDPALLRPGRFDRQIEVGLPGKKERLSILELHSQKKPLDKDVLLDRIAAQTAYFSGASLENMLNEAAIMAAEEGSEKITNTHISRALIRMIAGDDRIGTATEAERRIIALHEAGHAVAAKLLAPKAQLTRVSILPAGRGAAGYNLFTPVESVMPSKRDLENQVCILLAGRATEMLIGGEDSLTAGASNDLERAAQIVSAMVTELGMAGEPALSIRALSGNCPGNYGAGETARKILSDLFERTGRLLALHIADIERLASELLVRECLNGEEIDSLLPDLSNECQESTKAV